MKFLDGYIERMRVRYSDRSWENLAIVCGCYFGACIIAEHGGRWVDHPNAIGVEIGPSIFAFPIAKVVKQIEEGHEGGESILSFFNAVPAVAKRLSR